MKSTVNLYMIEGHGWIEVADARKVIGRIYMFNLFWVDQICLTNTFE